MTKIRLGYVGLLGLAAVIPAYRSWVLASTQWTPLNVAYPIRPTTLAPAEFTIDRDGVYELVLKIARPSDEARRKTAECLAGWDWGNAKWGQAAYGRPCQVTPVVGFEWHVVPLDGRPADGGVMEGIADGGGFSDDEADRKITAFPARSGQRYRFEGRTIRNAEALAFARPRIVMQPTGTTNKDEMVATLGYWAVAGLAGVVGLMLLVGDLWTSWRHAV